MKYIVTAFLSLILVTGISAHETTLAENKKVLLVAANQVSAPTTGWPVGFWIAELSHPFDEFSHAGYQVDIASPNGGKIVPDAYSDPRHESGYSASDVMSYGFLTSPVTAPLLENTIPLQEVTADHYDAIVVVGGQSPMFTFRDNKRLQKLITQFYESGKPTAALCHGLAALVDVKLSNGEYLVKGKKVTGFSLEEDRFVDQALGVKLFSWYIEEALQSRGAIYQQNGMWADYAVNDGNLITGQQQNSGRSVARMVIAQLNNS